MTTGPDLKEARELAGLTQAEVAAELGKHRTTINAWEQRAEVRRSNARLFLDAVDRLAKKRAA